MNYKFEVKLHVCRLDTNDGVVVDRDELAELIEAVISDNLAAFNTIPPSKKTKVTVGVCMVEVS